MPWYRLARLLASLTLLPLCTSFTLDRAGGDTPAVAEPTTPYRVSRRYAAGLEYLLIEPREVSADDELPMLVYLHGRASTPEAPRRRFFDIEIPVRIIMPRAPDRYGRGYSWMPVSAASGESPELTRALVARARMIAEATRVWRDRHPTRGLPIVVGFSQGGLLSMELAMHHPGAVAEAIPLAGWLPPSRMPTGPRDPYASVVPIHAVHGSADPVLAARRTAATIARLERLGFPASYAAIPDCDHRICGRMRPAVHQRVLDAIRRLPESTEAGGQS